MTNVISIYVVNLVFSTTILLLGLVSYIYRRDAVAILIGIAFGMFTLTNIGFLMGLEDVYTAGFMIVRSVGYILVLLAMFKIATK
jgi:hypothetical protein